MAEYLVIDRICASTKRKVNVNNIVSIVAYSKVAGVYVIEIKTKDSTGIITKEYDDISYFLSDFETYITKLKDVSDETNITEDSITQYKNIVEDQ